MTVRLADGQTVENVHVDHHLVRELLGPDKVLPELAERKLMPGVATGIGVSGTGGDLQFVEATVMPGRGEIRLTGSLGNVLREAAETVTSYVRSRADRLGLDPAWLDKQDLHIHVPRARAAVDSAGCGLAIYVAVASLLLRQNAKPSVGLVGELTLRGAVLPVEGIKDMLLAAHRGGLTTVVLPAQNERDLPDVPAEILQDLDLKLVHHVSEVLPFALDPNPVPQEPDPDAPHGDDDLALDAASGDSIGP